METIHSTFQLCFLIWSTLSKMDLVSLSAYFILPKEGIFFFFYQISYGCIISQHRLSMLCNKSKIPILHTHLK